MIERDNFLCNLDTWHTKNRFGDKIRILYDVSKRVLNYKYYYKFFLIKLNIKLKYDILIINLKIYIFYIF